MENNSLAIFFQRSYFYNHFFYFYFKSNYLIDIKMENVRTLFGVLGGQLLFLASGEQILRKVDSMAAL